MPIRITIEVDSVEQLNLVLSSWKTDRERTTTKTTPSVDITVKKPEGLSSLLKQMNHHPKQLALIKTLYENQDGLSDNELRAKLGLNTGNAFGGTLSGLTWQAKKLGLHGRDIVSREERKNAKGETYYFYKLTSEMVEMMKQSES